MGKWRYVSCFLLCMLFTASPTGGSGRPQRSGQILLGSAMVKPSAVGLGEEVPLKSMGVMHGSVLSNTAASKGNGHSIQEVGSSGTSSNVRKRPGNIAAAFFALAGTNVMSVCLLVVTNKVLFGLPGWNLHGTLLLLHLAVTYLYTLLAERLGFYTMPDHAVPWKTVAWNALCLNLNIGFMNLTLSEGSMSFYQLTKVLIAPSQALFQYLWYSKPSSLQAIGALATMTVGIGMLFVTDLHATPTSLLYGFAGVFFCTIAQAGVEHAQSKYDVSGIAYTRLLSKYQVLFMFIFSLFAGQFSFKSLGVLGDFSILSLLLVSCSLAFVVNLTSATILGKLNAITLQVVGHAKSIIVIGMGVAFFGEVLTFRGAFGLLVAASGVVWYTYLKLHGLT